MKNQNQFTLKFGILAMFCLIFVASCTQEEDAPIAAADAVVANFFTDLPEQDNARMAGNDLFDSEATFRKRFVTFDPVSLQAAISRESMVNLPLFGDAEFAIRTSEVKQSEDVRIWKGTIDGDPFSRVCLSYVGENVMGTIHTSDQVFRITPLGEGRHVIGEVYPSALPKEACHEEGRVAGPSVGLMGQGALTEIVSVSNQKTSGNVIRVMVVLSGLGSMCSNAIISNLYRTQCEESLNDVWNNGIYSTGYTASVVIACTNYNPIGEKFADDLDWLEANSAIANLRNIVSADLVAMLVPNGNACGLGNRPNVSSSTSHRAFSVTKYSCAFDNFSFPHEIGHNLGMRHDRYVYNNGGNANDCNYGYVYAFQNGVTGRSVMSYDDWCDDNGGDCKRAGVFSVGQTLNIGFLSIKLGIPCGQGISGINGSADNFSQFNTAAPIVAAYR